MTTDLSGSGQEIFAGPVTSTGGKTTMKGLVRFEDPEKPEESSERKSEKGKSRLQQPRMSLLGKPLNYRANRRDARYRRLQTRVYNFLERPRGSQAILYHIIVFFVVFSCLALSVFATIKEYQVQAEILLFYMEIIVVIWFSIEFCLRLWSSGCRSRYQGWLGRLKFLQRPFCIVDVITIAASLVVLSVGVNGQVMAASALRGLRFFQILRMVRMDRRGGTWKLLGSVVYAHRQELITTLYIGFLGLIFASFLVYLAEKDANPKNFSNFADALWWGVITLCTVGYGDTVPATWQGKLIASFCALLGISFFALPAGILGSGFALKVQQQQRQKHMIRRRQPAATLIQCLWRCYAADEHSLSVATWKIHQIPLPSPPSKAPGEAEKTFLDRIQPASSSLMVSSSFKHNASFVSRLPTIRRHKSTSFHSPLTKGAGLNRNSGEVRASSDNLGGTATVQTLNGSHSEDSVAETALSKKNSDAMMEWTKSRARRKKISNLLSPVQEEETPDEYEDDEPRYIQLTNQHKGAIRAIRKLKYFVARRKFREALKPYDVKDVMEQYSSGHADLLNRTRNLQYRLDQILGKQGSKAKDVYASKISLASRVVKIERQVDDIETKLDQLIELYMEDRKRILTIPLHQESQAQIKDGDGSFKAVVPVLPLNAQLLPKPILIEKINSEPNTPTSRPTFVADQKTSPKGGPGGLVSGAGISTGSAEGHQIKKKVTLSSFPTSQSATPLDEVGREGTKDVVIIVPTTNTGCVQTVVAVDNDPENPNSEYAVPTRNPVRETTKTVVALLEENAGDRRKRYGGSSTAATSSVQVNIYRSEPVSQVEMNEPGVDGDESAVTGPLLLTRAAGTEIIVTPTSRVNSMTDLSNNMTESVDLNLLCPDLDQEN